MSLDIEIITVDRGFVILSKNRFPVKTYLNSLAPDLEQSSYRKPHKHTKRKLRKDQYCSHLDK